MPWRVSQFLLKVLAVMGVMVVVAALYGLAQEMEVMVVLVE
jgi:hypothetical protein